MDTAFFIAHPLFIDLVGKLREASVQAWDLTTVFDELPGEVYLDFCHTNEVANEAVAEEIFNHIKW